MVYWDDHSRIFSEAADFPRLSTACSRLFLSKARQEVTPVPAEDAVEVNEDFLRAYLSFEEFGEQPIVFASLTDLGETDCVLEQCREGSCGRYLIRDAGLVPGTWLPLCALHGIIKKAHDIHRGPFWFID